MRCNDDMLDAVQPRTTDDMTRLNKLVALLDEISLSVLLLPKCNHVAVDLCRFEFIFLN